jgi:hypothetical protein
MNKEDQKTYRVRYRYATRDHRFECNREYYRTHKEQCRQYERTHKEQRLQSKQRHLDDVKRLRAVGIAQLQASK